MRKRKKGVALLLASALSLLSVFTTPASETAIDKEAFDALIASGKTAQEEEILESQWASSIREAGILRVGGTLTSFLFSQLDESDGAVRGFDAGLFQLLTRYILGDEKAYELTQVNSNTRETVLSQGQVDVVIATYSITEAREKLVSFAGPYYTSRQAVLVQARNQKINGFEDLKGKIVATQSGSTGPHILEDYIDTGMQIQEFKTDQQARTALKLGRVDAYVTDYTLLLNAIVRSPEDYRIAGDQFGPEDNYGVGLPLNSDGTDFVNGFLKGLVEDGTWARLWQITLGDRTGIETVPEPPLLDSDSQ